MWGLKKIESYICFCSAIILLSSFHSSPFEAALVWSAAESLSLPTKNAVYPQVSVNPGDNATVIWSRANGSNYVIEVTESSIGKAWTNPHTLSEIGENAFFAVIANDSSNNSVAAWARSNGTHSVIQAAHKLTHKTWSAPVNLSVSCESSNNATHPQIAVDSLGNVTVVWQIHDGVNHIIQASQKKVGRGWSSPENITVANPLGLGDINPQVAVDQAGTVYAVWVNDSTSTVRWAYKQLWSGWSEPLDLSKSGSRVLSATIALDLDGYPCAVWSQSNGTNYVVRAVFEITKGHLSPIRTLSSSGQDAVNPQIAVDALGNRAVVWQRFDGANTIVQASLRHKEGPWGIAVNVSEPGQDASSPQIEIDASGNIVAIWKRSNGSNFIIEAAQTTFANPSWSTPFALSDSGEDAVNPQLAVDKSGNVIAVWQRSDGFNSIVQAAFGVNN